MKRNVDKTDILIALGLSVFVSLLAFIWAYPYPHPDLWPVISALRNHVDIAILGVFGRLGLGVFAGLAYLLLRIVWFRNLQAEDEFPDRFLFARLAPLCGALLFAVLPAVWRAGQFLSPSFVLVLAEMIGVIAWLRSRGRTRYLVYAVGYLLLAFVGAVNPFAFGIFAYAGISDIIGRWQEGLEHGQQEDDLAAKARSMQEMAFSISASVIGFLLGLLAVARYVALHDFTWSIPRIFAGWWVAWLHAFDASLGSTFLLSVAGAAVGAMVAMAFGRRVRSVGEYGKMMAITLASLLALTVLIFVCRAYDGDARARLASVRDFLREVVRDTAGVRWFFTDGRLDDALRYEFAKVGSSVVMMDVMHAPSAEEGSRLRKAAPDFGMRELFAAGGAEVFRAWARERPDRLEESAWFTGGGILKLFGKSIQRSCGSVLRAKPKGDATAFDEADARQEKFMDAILAVAVEESVWRRIFGDIDHALADKFDTVMWRVARQATARADQLTAAGNVNGAERLNDRVRTLNSRNGTLYAQGETIERLLQTANLVPTPREALDIALRRADFTLAQRYAREVLTANPDDVQANFAMGMSNLEAKDYFVASRHFERVLVSKPNDPAVLNNLALAYMKLGLLDKAKDTAERALEASPSSPEIRSNLAEIKKALGL